MIQVAIMGHGVVGSGVCSILTTHKKKLYSAIGEEVYIKRILDLREFPDSPLADRFTKEFNDILTDVEIRVVAEVMGGIHPAYEFTAQLLKSGKSVVTSNKELVATHGAELLAIAKENNANYLFEASVGGGIPILRPMNQCLVANNVHEVAGILNGTTNFILTKMIDDGMEFNDALKLAQELGFAERNPAADVEGHDACRKICILASLASGKHVYPKGIHTEGITNISLNDVKYASSFNSVIKLIGDVKFLENGKLDIFVAPMIVNRHSQLANIDNEFNGIMVRGDCTDDVVFYGKGAGSLPTASAVVADIIDCCKHLKARKYLFWADSNNENVLPYNESVTAVYLRFSTNDKEASIAEVRDLFGDIVQLSITNESENEFAVVTKAMTIGEINDKLNQVKKSKLLSNIRIADL